MRLLNTQIVGSLLVAIASFGLYASPFPPFLLTLEQAHEALLAVFGAGVSIFFASIIEYPQRKNELEDKVLRMAEPLVSALAGLECFSVEGIGGSEDASALLMNYLEEEESNAFRRNHEGWPAPERHSVRDGLICSIEGCELGDCERFANDPDSSSSRYVSRAKRNLESAAERYRHCGKVLDKSGSLFDDELAKLTYITGVFCGTPILKHLSGARKTCSLREVATTKASIVKALEPAFGQARLFESEDRSYLELLSCLVGTQKECKKLFADSTCAKALFKPVSDFAALTGTETAKHYEEPWW